MIVSEVLNKTLLTNETKFLTGLSFIVISLISLHYIFYQNFYNFSDSWIEKESKKITIQISPYFGEKRVPEITKINILNMLEKNDNIEGFEFITDETIKKDLGLQDLHSFSKIRIPMLLKILMKSKNDIFNTDEIRNITNDRKIKVHKHVDDLREIKNLIYRVKIFIFLFGSIITLLFFLLLTNLLKTTLIYHYKFIDNIQIMGAGSKEISMKLSVIIIKKILPGSSLGIIFASIISSAIINIFNIPFLYSTNIVFDYFREFVLLTFFISFVLLFLFLYSLVYLFHFLEKRFFA